MSLESSQPGAGRWQVPALAVLFVGPVLLAWVMVAMDWYPERTMNNGALVQPPERLAVEDWQWDDGAAFDAGWFNGRWTLLMTRPGACEAACRKTLDKLTRARLALDKDRTRVEILLLRPAGGADAADIPAREIRAPAAELRKLAAARTDAKGREAAVHLVDNQGLRMMTYPVPLDTEGVVEDLERLLENADADVERIQRLRHQDGNA